MGQLVLEEPAQRARGGLVAGHEQAQKLLELKFWKLVMSGANNLAYHLAYNTVVRGVRTDGVYALTRALLARELKKTGYRGP